MWWRIGSSDLDSNPASQKTVVSLIRIQGTRNLRLEEETHACGNKNNLDCRYKSEIISDSLLCEVYLFIYIFNLNFYLRVCNSCYAELVVNFAEEHDGNTALSQERIDKNGGVAVAEKNGNKGQATVTGQRPVSTPAGDDSRLRLLVRKTELSAAEKHPKTTTAAASAPAVPVAAATGEEEDNDEEEEEEDVVTEICDNLRAETEKSAV